jgi:hypothetical protein
MFTIPRWIEKSPRQSNLASCEAHAKPRCMEATEAAIAGAALTRMLEFGRPTSVRIV